MTNENGNLVMPVSPMGGYGNGGMFGMDGGWWIILLLLCLGGGWGNGFGGFGGGMFPWMMGGQVNTNNDIQRGFDQAAIISGITGVQNAVTSGIGDIQTALCGCFANVQNGFAQAEIAANARQMAGMNQNFGIQTAIAGVGTATQAGLADLKYTIANEACATRAASSADRQMIMDKLCQLELDGVKAELASAQRENVALQNQLNMASFKASQIEQNAFIQQGLNNEVDALYNRLSNCPVPSTPVYGRTPIFTCGGNGCGCGMAA